MFGYVLDYITEYLTFQESLIYTLQCHTFYILLYFPSSCVMPRHPHRGTQRGVPFIQITQILQLCWAGCCVNKQVKPSNVIILVAHISSNFKIYGYTISFLQILQAIKMFFKLFFSSKECCKTKEIRNSLIVSPL